MKRLLISVLGALLFTGSVDAQLPIPFNLRVTAVDQAAPVVTITAPTSGTTYDAGSTTPLTTLAGTCTDNVAVSIVTWSNDQGGSGTATGTTSWSVASIALSSGVTNTITVTCTDTAENTHQDTLAVSFTSGGAGSPCSHCFFEASFDEATWPDGTQDGFSTCTGSATLEGVQAGIDSPGDWLVNPANASHCTGFHAAANYSGGLGGNGYRSWFGEGQNNYGGTLFFDFCEVTSCPQQEIWFRFYARWQSGADFFHQKFPYFNLDNCGPNVAPYTRGCYWLIEDDQLLLHVGAGYDNRDSSTFGWTDLQGGQTSDESWHCFEFHMKAETADANNDGQGDWWIDGDLKWSRTDVDFAAGSSPGFRGFQLPGNVTKVIVVGGNGVQDSPETSAANWMDVDDLAISSTQRINCF